MLNYQRVNCASWKCHAFFQGDVCRVCCKSIESTSPLKYSSGWWCNNHLEKYEFVNGKDYPIPIGSMYGIYANMWAILMGSMLPYIAYIDPMGYIMENKIHVPNHQPVIFIPKLPNRNLLVGDLVQHYFCLARSPKHHLVTLLLAASEPESNSDPTDNHWN